MTTEQKAKAYDELFSNIKQLYNSVNPEWKNTIEKYIPELVESKDEKIRRGIINYIKSTIVDKDVYSPWVAWLEKRGKQNSVEVLPIKGNYYMCIKEYATYDEPEFKVGKVYLSEKDGTITAMNGGQFPFKDAKDFFRLATHQEVLSLLKLKPTEWSEEDEEAVEMAIIALEDMFSEDEPLTTYVSCTMPFDKAAERLRALRPQKLYKLSENPQQKDSK